MVIFPVLLRPPEDLFVLEIRLFSGVVAVISAKSAVILYLKVGVSGLYFLNAIFNSFFSLNACVEIDHLTLFQGNDCFFSAVNTANSQTPGSVAAFHLTNILLSVNRINL